MTTNQVTRNAITAHLEMDARLEHSETLAFLIAEAAGELAKLEKLRNDLSIEVGQPDLALEVLAGLGQSKRIERLRARVHALLVGAQREAILLARAHGASWTQIGDALEEDGRNVAARFK